MLTVVSDRSAAGRLKIGWAGVDAEEDGRRVGHVGRRGKARHTGGEQLRTRL